MADNRYRHIFLSEDYYEQTNFTSPKTGRGKTIPRRNVQEHSQFLRSKLDRVWREAHEKSEQRRAVSLPVGVLKQAGVAKEENYLLTWIGEKPC